jgi:hypothetical protein
VKARGLRGGVNYYEWLDDHGLGEIPEHGVFYAVGYDRSYPNNPSEALESCPLFRKRQDAEICAYELSRGNMPRAVIKCEVVSRSKAHDK